MAFRQHESAVHVENAGWNEVNDLLVRLFLDPGVDRLAGVFRGGDEIDFLQAGAVMVLADLGEFGEEAVVFLSPEAIGDGELKSLFWPFAWSWLISLP